MGGSPQRASGRGSSSSLDGEPASIRFLFGPIPEGLTELHPISWEQFFATFDLLGWSFVYDDENSWELLQIEAKSAYRFDGKPV